MEISHLQSEMILSWVVRAECLVLQMRLEFTDPSLSHPRNACPKVTIPLRNAVSTVVGSGPIKTPRLDNKIWCLNWHPDRLPQLATLVPN